MRFLIINGPNLNMLGLREPGIYGDRNYATLCALCEEWCAAEGIECELFQSNHEGAIVDKIQEAYGKADGIVINPAAYTHTSVAILDALKAVAIPTVEVHISKVSERESFRQISFVSYYAARTIQGMGFEGYGEAIRWLKGYITDSGN
ncbi:MAG: type II 3-dehydroquinate dehydratase [Clostridia bacterium]|nr:type II 3-dehydroquinate dehydratase [Clostridia bacterium]